MKYYANAMPKAGLHLLDALLKPLTLNPEANWAGTYTNSSWTLDRAPIEQITTALSYMPDNWRVKGHACYDEGIDVFMALGGIAHVFMYRDLRDVAVSQAHHILSDDDSAFMHLGKEQYRALGGFDDVLFGVWHGIPGYPGIMARWAEYEPWLTCGQVLALNYADTLADLEGTAQMIIDYSGRIVGNATASSRVDSTAADMAASARDTASSPTFRRGVPGEWRKYAEVMEAWE